MTTADAFYAYGDNLRSTAIQTNTVSQCFDYGRTYSGGVNARTALTAPYFQKTNSLLGGACNNSTQSCYTLNTNGKRYASPVAISSLLPGHRRSVGRDPVLPDGDGRKREHESVLGLTAQLARPLDEPDRDVLHERFRSGDQHDPGGSGGDGPAAVAAAWAGRCRTSPGPVAAQSTGQPVVGATVKWSGRGAPRRTAVATTRWRM